MFQKNAQALLDFIEKSPCSYHVIETMKKDLEAAGFQRLQEQNPWSNLIFPCGRHPLLWSKYDEIKQDLSFLPGWRLPYRYIYNLYETYPHMNHLG